MKSPGKSEYVLRARDAESRARKACDSVTREVWRQIADGYWRMADAGPGVAAGNAEGRPNRRAFARN